MGEAFLDQGVAQRLGPVERGGERLGSVAGEDVGGVGAVGPGGVAGVEAVGGEVPEGAFGGDLAGDVGVGADDRIDPVVGELGGLFVGEGGAERRHPDVAAAAGEGDGDGVDGSFDDDRDLTGGEVLPAEQLGAFVEQRGFGGVEVFRSGEGGVGVVGVAAADEPEHLTVVVGDGEDDPVAEAVDQPAGAGAGGDPGGRAFPGR